jgi:hypothetical protein
MLAVTKNFICSGMVSLLLIAGGHVNAQTWQWAKTGSLAPNTSAVASAVVADASGNVYVTGNFDATSVTFGSVTLTNTSPPASDIFLVKYSAAGAVLWAKSFGGTSYDEGNALCVDKAGNILLAGAFNSPNMSMGSYNLAGAGGDDFFIAKLDNAGTVLWAINGGGSGNDVANGVCVDRRDNVCITGSFDSSIIPFSSGNIGNTSGSTTPLVVKYDSTGMTKWARAGRGNGGLHGNSGAAISADTLSDLFITGGFSYPELTFGTDSIPQNGITNVFVLKYDSAGNVLWLKRAGGVNEDAGTGISADRFGNAYITGGFNSPTILFGSNTLTNAGASDLFVVKYDKNGNVLWASGSGGSGVEQGTSICTDANGFAYVSGTFGSSSFSIGSTDLINAGVLNIFMAEYTWGGQALWAKNVGGSASDYGLSAFADVSGNAYIAGYFSSPAITFGSTNLIYTGTANMYVAKISGITGIESLAPASSTISVYPNPASTSALFHMESDIKGDYKLMIYDQLGQVTRSIEKIQSQDFSLNCDGLASGIYFYVMKNDQEQAVGKGKLIIAR